MKKNRLKKLFSIISVILIALLAMPVVDVYASPDYETYNAYFGLQTPNWSFRNSWNDSTFGIHSVEFDSIMGFEGDYFVEKPGDIHDTIIDGNGTYTVSVTNFGSLFADDFNAAGQDCFNLLFVSTDIPLSENLSITDVKFIVDGKICHTDKNAYIDPDETEYVKIIVQNIWNTNKSEISYYQVPTESIEIQFTVSGLPYDNWEQAIEKETEMETHYDDDYYDDYYDDDYYYDDYYDDEYYEDDYYDDEYYDDEYYEDDYDEDDDEEETTYSKSNKSDEDDNDDDADDKDDEDSKEDEDSEDNSTILIIVIIVAGVVFLCAVIAIIVMVKKYRK